MWLTIKPKLQVAHIAHPTIEPSKWRLKHIRNIYQTQGRATSATPGFRHFLCLSILSTNRRLHWSTELILQLSPIHIRHPWAILKQLAAVRKLISKIKVSPFYDANWKRPFFSQPIHKHIQQTTFTSTKPARQRKQHGMLQARASR